jgi:O-antigen ligase
MTSLKLNLRTRSYYLDVALVTPVIAAFAAYGMGGNPLWRGQSAAIWISIIGCVVSFLLWLPFRPTQTNTTLGSAALVAVLLVWTLQTCLILVNGSVFNISTFAFPMVIAQVLMKPPGFKSAQRSCINMSFALVAIGVMAVVLTSTGLATDSFDPGRTGPNRIPILTDLLGISGRWEGPYGNVNYAAPVGGFLLIFSLGLRGVNRLVLGISGLVVLLLAQGRTALLATIAAVLAFILAKPRRTIGRSLGRPLRWLVVIGITVAAALAIRITDPTFSGRTGVWRDYFELWLSNPVRGVGQRGIENYLASGGTYSEVALNHGHSIFLDTLARYGLVLMIPGLILMILVICLGVRSIRVEGTTVLAIGVFAVCSGIAETTISWNYLSLTTLPLIVAVILGACATGSARSQVSLKV